jgi:hypothetical protein
MKLFLFTAAFLFTTVASAKQLNDSIPLGSDYISGRPPQSYKATFRITADQIAHFPFTNITEVLNGMFPYVFGDPLNASDYNFLVDGKLTLNPNAVNVSQVAAIEFYPVYFGIGNGSLSGKGTFIIHIKHRPEQNGFSIRSQAGVLLPTDKSAKGLPSAFFKPNKKELFTYQDIGYNLADDDLTLTSAFSYTRNAFTGYDDLQSDRRAHYDHGFNRLRFSNFIGYNVSDKLKLTGTLGLYSHSDRFDTGNELIGSDASNTFDVLDKAQYGIGTLGAEYQWSSRLRNTLVVEYNRLKRHYETESYTYRPAPNADEYVKYDLTIQEQQIAVTNTLRGIAHQEKNFALHWELLLRYYSKNLDEDLLYRHDMNGQPYQLSEGNLVRKHRSLAVMPRVGVSLNDQLFVTAGLTYDSWTNDISVLSNDDDASGKAFPYAGVRWSMPAAGSQLSSLHIHTTYGASLLRGSGSDQLDFRPNSSGYFGTYSYDPMPSPKEGYRWISGIDAGLMEERLLVSLNYFLGRNFPAIIFGGSNPIRYEEVKQRGLSASVQAKISDKEKFKCDLRAILFYERNELADQSPGSDPLNSLRRSNPFLNDDISPEWRGSFQANISSGGVFLQAVALLRPTEGRWQQSSQREKFNNSGLSFLSAGYRLSSAKVLKNLEVSIQTRNLLLMKEPASDIYKDRYVGVGLKANL